MIEDVSKNALIDHNAVKREVKEETSLWDCLPRI